MSPPLLLPPFPGARALGWAVRAGRPADAALEAALADALADAPPLGRWWRGEQVAVADPAALAAVMVREWRWICPFTGTPSDALAALRLSRFWRDLVRANRGLVAALGVGGWKQDALAPLLWDGTRRPRFRRRAPPLGPRERVAVWRARVAPRALDGLDAAQIVEIEDGFIRSAGLGADCVPPLSIVLDRQRPHFDPAGPSDLEALIARGDADPATLARAQALRERIVAGGLGKYEVGTAALPRPGGARRHVLVPGQVEDDRSVQLGGGPVKRNLDLLVAARAANPDAYLLYKPHPDVEAGHRAGAIPDEITLAHADAVVRDQPIGALIAMVDQVETITSLAGFEALLRGKTVACHGTPFYAGWGLTIDRGPVPARRQARPSLDALVAAVLLDYPRYVDPATGLPCPAEIVVDRLLDPEAPRPRIRAGWLVPLRRWQGRLNRWRRR